MSARDPDNADYYAANYDAFAALIDELDAAMRDVVRHRARCASCSPTTTPTPTSPRTYGWDVIGAIQVSDFEDPTPREVAELIEQVEAEDVPAIFGSEVFPSPVLEQIGQETGVEYVDVLRDDDLPGEPGDAEHSWLGLMRFDYITMIEALGGDAVGARGRRGRATSPPTRPTYPQ